MQDRASDPDEQRCGLVGGGMPPPYWVCVNSATVKKICDGLEIDIVQFFDCPLFRDLEQEIR